MNKKFLVLREIYNNKKFNKEKFCYRYNICFNEFDNYINELDCIDKFILKKNNRNYVITNEGLLYLNKFKVDTAILLASGIGQRMGEITKKTSKCLLKVNGEVLIERLIKQLLEKNIKNIVVLVGHVKEQFEYLINKYNVKLIYNPEYNKKNTIASFYNIINEIENKNSYIIASDIYLTENIFNEYECEPYYIGAWLDDCENEWVYNYDENNKVNSVYYGNDFNYYLGGFSFHTKDEINKLIDLVKIEYKKENSYNMYWEDILVSNFDVLPNFYVKKIPYGIMKEFDTVDDIEKEQDSLLYLKNEISKNLGISAAQKIFLKKIDAGISNESYLLTKDSKKYIVRKPGVATGLFVDRKKEKNIYNMLDSLDITDKIIYFDEKTGLKISKYFENSQVINVNSEKELRDCILTYKKLHTLDVRVDENINVFNTFKKYIKIMDKYKIKYIYDDFEKIYKKCKILNEYVKRFDRPNLFCHGDSGYSNVLKTDFGIKIIDFEFAGMADPLTDIALFSIYGDLNIDKSIDILKIYINLEVKKQEILKLENLDINDMINIFVSYMAIDAISSIIWDLIRSTITNKYLDGYVDKKNKNFNECICFLERRGFDFE